MPSRQLQSKEAALETNLERLYTWWSYRAKDWRASDKGRRLDHVWVSPELGDKAVSHSVLEDARSWGKPSDHAPLITEFEF